MTVSISEALYELCGFARVSCEADLVVALEVDAGYRAAAVAVSPALSLPSFNLRNSRVLERAWQSVPVDASEFRLPSAVINALPDLPTFILFVPAGLEHAPCSGLLLLWTTPAAPPPLVHHVPLLSGSVASALGRQREAVRQAVMRDQFNDLLESVPAGIIVFDGDGHGVMVNERAAQLLGTGSGRLQACDVSEPMRMLRERCDNREELDALYAGHVGDVHYSVTTHWINGERTYEVDTHPVRGDGERGRIWLFSDVTAELRMAANLRRMAETDPLTGAANRRSLESEFARIVKMPSVQDRAFAVLMIDVDHFKQINDTFGHSVGDDVLREVAARCRTALRENDLFARFGGEEFVAVLVAPQAAELTAIAERVRRSIADPAISSGPLSIPLTVSVGVASGLRQDASPESFLAALIAQADSALYTAKQSGRNRVVSYLRQRLAG
jgi:diguanylate cyclase (GGDEF)-like protein/PAS domain S-box-containing protein